MTTFAKNIWGHVLRFADRYPILLAGIIIYAYYLITSLDLFTHDAKNETLLDYFLQYDSLFILWIAAAMFFQLRKTQKTHREEEQRLHDMEQAITRQQLYETIVNEITTLLQDNVNNPLAVISVSSREIRKKFDGDQEINRGLDRIDASIQRIHNTIRDLQAYEARKILEGTKTMLEESAKGIHHSSF